MTDEVHSARRPYPGLRPFREEEAEIFFGRDAQTNELLTRLARQRFIAVTGPSGCGKSSLVIAGMIPALRSGLAVDAGSNWRVCPMRPGRSPMRALATALATREIVGAQHLDAANPDRIEAALRFGPRGLVDVLRESTVLGGASVLLLVDQFEEIFRFRERISQDEADAFVHLLLATAGQTALPVYVVITMRSDYLGDCTVFQGLPQAINDGQYLTPRLTRDECAQAIQGPARVFGGDVEAGLLNALLNDFGPDPDQLPLLQHALMRMWQRKADACAVTHPGQPVLLERADYAQRLGEALDRHADEVLHTLTNDEQWLAQVLFRRLTERAPGRRDTRAPALLGEVAAVAGLEPARAVAALAPVIDAFRREGCNFIVASPPELGTETLLDIGHESLIRQWKTLSGWVEAEAESAAVYVRLADAARRHARNQAALLWEPDLQHALQWQAQEHPGEAWAARYRSREEPADAAGEEFRRVEAYLEASRRAWDDAQERKRQREEDARRRDIDEARRQAEADAARADAQRAHAELNLERAQKVAAARRRRNVALAGLAALLALAVLGLWGRNELYGWMLTPAQETYADFHSVRGVPRGIGPALTAEQISRRAVSYQITKKCRRVPGRFGQWLERIDDRLGTNFSTAAGACPQERIVEMRAINASGELTTAHRAELSALGGSDDAARPARKGVRWQYLYDDLGRIAYEVELDRKGRLVRSLVYSPADQGSAPSQRTRQLLDEGGFPLPPTGDMCASTETVEFASPEGYEWRYRYKDRFGEPAPGRDHVPVQELRRDERGFLLEVVSLDFRGGNGELVPIDDAMGNASVRYSDFDRFGQGRRVEYRGADGELVEMKGVAAYLRAFDAVGNQTEELALDAGGRPATGSEGWHRRAIEYGAKGTITRETFWAVDGSAAAQRDRCHEMRWTYDDAGRRIGGACSGIDGRPGGLDAPTWRIEYDGDGNTSAWSYWDAAGRQPVLGREGWHRLVRKHDDRGNLVIETYLDVHGKAVRLKRGHAGTRFEYDDRNQLVRRVYLDPDEHATLIADGYAELRYAYDENGKRTSERYFDADGNMAWAATGFVGVDFERDTCGQETERRFVGPDGRPVTIADGHSGERNTYDRLGRAVMLQYTDASGRPTAHADGVAGWRDSLDRFGNIVERRYFGTDGRPVADVQGKAGWRQVFDRWGNVTREDSIDLSGRLVATEGEAGYRYASTVWVRDPLGHAVEEAYFGMRGEPVYLREGYARRRLTRDELGRLVQDSYLGAECQAVQTDSGFHRVRYRLDERGRTIGEEYFDPQGAPVKTINGSHRVEFTTDVHGRELGRRHYDAANRPVAGGPGWHEMRVELDALGREVHRSYWDSHGKADLSADATHHAVHQRLDQHGRVVERRYVDRRQRPTAGPEGVSVVQFRHDKSGRLVEQIYRGPDGRLMQGDGRFARKTVTHDRLGRTIAESYFGTDGRLRTDEFARAEFSYGTRTLTERRYRANGLPSAGAGTFAARITRLDASGQEVESTWFDAHGRPTPGRDNYWARLTHAYDERGREVELSGFSSDPWSPTGLALQVTRRSRFDQYGHAVEMRWLGPTGEPVEWNDVARELQRFDWRGQIVEAHRYGLDGMPVHVPDPTAANAAIERSTYDERGHLVLRRYFDAQGQLMAVRTAVGYCAAVRWHPDARGQSPRPEGDCLDARMRPADADTGAPVD